MIPDYELIKITNDENRARFGVYSPANITCVALSALFARAEAAEVERDHQMALVNSWISKCDEIEAARDELARKLENEQKTRGTVVKAASNLARANEKLAAELLALKVKTQS
jgi:hypothetical protein